MPASAGGRPKTARVTPAAASSSRASGRAGVANWPSSPSRGHGRPPRTPRGGRRLVDEGVAARDRHPAVAELGDVGEGLRRGGAPRITRGSGRSPAARTTTARSGRVASTRLVLGPQRLAGQDRSRSTPRRSPSARRGGPAPLVPPAAHAEEEPSGGDAADGGHLLGQPDRAAAGRPGRCPCRAERRTVTAAQAPRLTRLSWVASTPRAEVGRPPAAPRRLPARSGSGSARRTTATRSRRVSISRASVIGSMAVSVGNIITPRCMAAP